MLLKACLGKFFILFLSLTSRCFNQVMFFSHYITQGEKSSHQKCSIKKGVLRSFAKFTEKHLCQSLFFDKVTGGGGCNFIKKETLAQVFSREFCEISKNTFFKEHLWTTASEGEYMFLWLCEYTEFNHTSTIMIFFIIVHMLKHTRK